MYFPTRSASALVPARTRLWTENPECCHQKAARVLEEHPQPLGDGENHLAVGDIEQERLPHPFAPLLKPLGMAGGAEAPGAAGEHHEPLLMAVRTPDAGSASQSS